MRLGLQLVSNNVPCRDASPAKDFQKWPIRRALDDLMHDRRFLGIQRAIGPQHTWYVVIEEVAQRFLPTPKQQLLMAHSEIISDTDIALIPDHVFDIIE